MLKNFRLKTERLEIVPQLLKYLDSTYAYASDRENMRFMIFLPSDSIDETANFLRGAEAEWQSENPRDLECAIFCNGKHIGGINLELLDDGGAEMGWCLAKSAQGNGYAFEAARALVEWTRESLGVKKFIAHCDSENVPSWKTMEKLGMKRVSCYGGRHNKINPTEDRQEFLYEMVAAAAS